MRKIFFAFVLLMSIGTVCFAQEGSPIEPELQSLLNNAGEEKFSITIVLKSQPEPSAIRAKVAASRGMKVAGEVVVSELKKHSINSQTPLMTYLQSEEANGRVANISSLWIANTVCCDAVREVIYELALRNDIAIIGCNKEVQMLCNSQNDFLQLASVNARASLMPQVQQVNASQAWEQGYTGKNVVVAILDSGINDEHVDLKDHLWQGYADTDGDGEADDLIHGWNYVANNANIKDDNGHGTHCAGIICGDGTSGNITGIAPDATLMTLKTVNRVGGGSPTYMIKGVQFAVENGAKILSISSGFKANQISDSDKEALRRTFVNVLEAGVISFVAAGNDGESGGDAKFVDYPAACPPPYLHPDQRVNAGGLSSVVCVGAVNANDEYAKFSSQGPATWQGTEWDDYLLDDTHIGLIRPDICAPGELIYSLKHTDNDKYELKSGTSQATPCVAGVAALMLEKNVTLSPADICRIIETTAKKLTENKNNLTGSGRVDALNAVNAVEAVAGSPYLKVSSYSPEYFAQDENCELSIFVTNDGSGASSADATVTLLTDDKYVTIPQNILSLGCLASKQSKEVVAAINISPEAVNGHTVYVKVVITDGANSWNDELVFRVKSYAKIMGDVKSPKTVKAGQEVTLKVNIENKGTVATTADTDLTLDISKKSSSYVTFINNKATLGVIAPGEKQVVEFSFKVNEETPDGANLLLDLYATPNNYSVAQDMVYGFEIHTDQYGYLEDGFEGWTTFDASNDGRNHPWWHSLLSAKHRMAEIGTHASGKGHAVSESYCQASLQVYTMPIDNYLVSPKVKATADSWFSFKARVHSSDFYGEHFGVAISETENNDASSFETIKEWVIDRSKGSGWLDFSVDLSEYAGKEIYVAIRHFFTQDEWDASGNGLDYYALHVDDAKFSDVIDVSTNFVYDNYSYFTVKVGDVVEEEEEDDEEEGGETPAPEEGTGDGTDGGDDDLKEDETSINDANETSLSLYFNDSDIVIVGATEGCVVSVYDISGRNVLNADVKSSGTLRLPTKLLGKGVYLIKVTDATVAKCYKVMK